MMEMIEAYDFGRIVINGVLYTNDVITCGETVKANWWRKDGHLLQVADISHALEEFAPQVVIVGTGHDGMMRVPEETKIHFQRKGIELLVKKTRGACDLFNELSRTKRALAALHLTC